MQSHSSTNRQHIVPDNQTQTMKPSAALTLEVEVLEERIAPAYLGGIQPIAPCCASR